MDINVNGTIRVVVDIPCLKSLLDAVSKAGVVSILHGTNENEPEKVAAPVAYTAPENEPQQEKQEEAKPVPVSDTPKEEVTKPVPVAKTVITHELLRQHLLQVRNAARKAGKSIFPQEQLKEKLTTFGVEKLNDLSPEQVAEMYAWVDKESANA